MNHCEKSTSDIEIKNSKEEKSSKLNQEFIEMDQENSILGSNTGEYGDSTEEK